MGKTRYTYPRATVRTFPTMKSAERHAGKVSDRTGFPVASYKAREKEGIGIFKTKPVIVIVTGKKK